MTAPTLDTAGVTIRRDGFSINLTFTGPGITVSLTPVQARSFAISLLEHVEAAAADRRTNVSIRLGTASEAVMDIRTAIRFAEQLTAIAIEEGP